MSYSTLIAYALTFLIPAAIIGFSAFAKNIKVGFLLGWVSFMSLMAYYNYKGLIETWILILILIIISIVFAVLFNGLFGGGSDSE